MSIKQQNKFEVIITDVNGNSEISSVKSLIMAICYSEKLWKEAEIREERGEFSIEDKTLQVFLKASRLQVQPEIAFLIQVTAAASDKLEAFRERFLAHTIHKIGFSAARIIADTVSESLSLAIYPLIKTAENGLRSYLEMALTQNAGLNWWKETVSPKLAEAVNQRKQHEVNLTGFLENNMSLTTFEDLSEIVQQTSLGDNAFKTKWNALSVLRQRVLTYSVFSTQDIAFAQSLSSEVLALIPGAESRKPVYTITAAASAPVQKAEETPAQTVQPVREEPVHVYVSETVQPQVVYHTSSEEKTPEHEPALMTASVSQESGYRTENRAENKEPGNEGGLDFITESVLLQELKHVQSQESNFVDLKAFVTKTLGSKGYAFGPAYLMAKNLNDKGMVQIYEARDPKGTLVKAIKLKS